MVDFPVNEEVHFWHKLAELLDDQVDSDDYPNKSMRLSLQN